MNLPLILFRGAYLIAIFVLLLPLEGCVPEASVQWTMSSDKKNTTSVNEDIEDLGKMLGALGYIEKGTGNLSNVNYFSYLQSGRIKVMLTWSQENTIPVRLIEGGVKEFSSQGRQQMTLINDELNRKFGLERITHTKF
jgi:hypothetical protein